MQLKEYNQFFPLIQSWLQQTTYREQCLFLETHPELLQPECDQAFVTLMERNSENAEVTYALLSQRQLLHHARQRGGSVRAIRTTYVDRYGGFMLDQPDWLAKIYRQFLQLSQKTPSRRSRDQRRIFLQKAIARVQQHSSIPPEIYAELQFFLADTLKEYSTANTQYYETAIVLYKAALQVYTQSRYPCRYAAIQYTLGNTYRECLTEDRSEIQEQAITCYQEALHVYTLQTFPLEWARTKNNLGTLLQQRVTGSYSTNLEQAIACYQEILQVYTESDFPTEWAATQNNLSAAYCDRVAGERRFNLEDAIACATAALRVYQRETFPADWAWTFINLGNAYSDRLLGKRSTNLEQAIVYYQSALEVYTYSASPVDWAMLQHNLGNIYRERIKEDHRMNVEQAIAHHQSALRVYTPMDFPYEWASVQNGLGNAFQERIEGERRINQEQAIAHFSAALSFRTRQNFPHEWATTCQNLGVTYSRRIEGERRANLEQAIAYYRNALEIHTREAFPVDWAMTQQNIGDAYLFRVEGERRANLEQSIAACHAALEIYTREAFPVEWAGTHYTLSNAYGERIEGNPRANLEQAIAACHAALQVYTREAFPDEWARTQHSLGTIYGKRIAGERRANLEMSISCQEAALQVYSRETFPVEWAMTQHSLGNAWHLRIPGKRSENLERAITCYQEALRVYRRASSAEDWARTTHALGNAYFARVVGSRRENLEQALTCYAEAAQVYTYSAFPLEWARLHEDKGHTYLYRVAAEHEENLEQAIACYQAALQVYTYEAFPEDWARTQQNLGIAYYHRLAGEQQMNLHLATECCQAALRIYTPDAFPDLHRRTQRNLAAIAALQGHWGEVDQAFTQALIAEDLLVRLGAGTTGRDVILKEGYNTATQHAFALMRLGQIERAAVAIELGRTRGLAEALMLDTTDPEQISDTGRRFRYKEARQQFIEAQSTLNIPLSSALTEQEQRQLLLQRTEVYHEALSSFDNVVTEIRAEQKLPDFLREKLDAQAILDIAARQGPEHALVYLAATPWGGMAIAALVPPSGEQAYTPFFAALELPTLTDAAVEDILEMPLDDRQTALIGGLLHAQESRGLDLMLQQWSGTTFRDVAMALHAACEAVHKTSMLDTAAQFLLASPAVAHLVDRAFEQLDSAHMEELASTLDHYFLQLEVQRCLEILGDRAMRPLIPFLRKQGMKRLTLIPCGYLAAFPLTAVSLTGSHTVAETLPTSISLSARSLPSTTQEGHPRAGVYALGDPHPTRQPLRWGEAEAHTLAKLARIRGWQGEAKVQYRAERKWAVQVLQQGLIVDTSCHGTFNSDDFLQSALLLANGQHLTLAEMLNREVDMRGLRLLILSACQSATLDLRGASDEVRSLAAGVIQAGARAVLASLWSVDDRATYLLIVRFAQEWFPRMTEELPAVALARAQCWLRHVTNRELQDWQATSLLPISIQEQQEAGAQELEQERRQDVYQEMIPPRAVVRGRGTRYELKEAEALLHDAAKGADSDTCPYADPIYWAGFQVTGW